MLKLLDLKDKRGFCEKKMLGFKRLEISDL